MKPGGETLDIWTVYDHPKDFPDYYVARLFKFTDQGTYEPQNRVKLAKDVATLRDWLVGIGMTNLGRYPEDDAAILESWI